MAVDRYFEGNDGSGNRLANSGPCPPIDHARRQMQQQIDQPRGLVAAEQIAQQPVLLRSNAAEACDRCKQWIEQSRAHQFLGSHVIGEAYVLGAKTTMPGNQDAVEKIDGDKGLTSFPTVAISTRAPGTSGLLALIGIEMTGSTRSSGGLDDRRKRLLFRCWHRGTREMDLILGRFADAEIVGLSDLELSQLEALIDVSDPDLYAALTGDRTLAPEYASALFDRIKAFRAGDHLA